MSLFNVSIPQQRESGTASPVELYDALWLHICQYLVPCDRFKLSGCCLRLNDVLSRDNYPFVAFYGSDINYWIEHIQPLQITEPVTMPWGFAAKHSLALKDLWKLRSARKLEISRNLKYFVIFHGEISRIRSNQRRASRLSQLLMSLVPAGGVRADRELFAKIEGVDFIPSEIESVLLDRSNDVDRDHSVTRWVADCIKHCHSECLFFKNLKFEDSRLDSDAVGFLCDALSSRATPLRTLQSISLASNRGIGSQAAVRLLGVLSEQCPNLESLSLAATGMDNAGCTAIASLWRNHLKLRGETPLGKLKNLDLRHNVGIDANGITLIVDQLASGVYPELTVRIAGCGFATEDLTAWGRWIDPDDDFCDFEG